MSSHVLMDRLANFGFDEPGVAFTFSQRLAGENGWSVSYVDRVLEEYRRFLFLACEAGHPVTPSDQVDQVWHLHLTYTRSYWDELCDGVLQKRIHHGPTRGGVAEQSKFDDWYNETLRSYEKFFSEPAPVDIWPSSDVRFGSSRFQRVDLDDHFLVSRSKVLGTAKTSVIGTGLVLMAGCTAATTDAVLGVPGLVVGAFLVLCLVVAVVVVVAGSRQRKQDSSNQSTSSESGMNASGGFFGRFGGGEDSGGGWFDGDGGGGGCGGGGCGGG